MLVYKHTDGMAILLVYVDDIVLTASTSSLLTAIINKLKAEFSMTDMGELHYFLGIQVHKIPDGLFVSQKQYTQDLLARAGMADASPVGMPIKSHLFTADQSHPFHDPSMYRSIVGALQYLTFTRPEIAYAVNTVCQFIHHPLDVHWQWVKRILRYLKGTMSCGLRLTKSSLNILSAYSDANWAGCPDTRRSITGYCVFLGNNLIS